MNWRHLAAGGALLAAVLGLGAVVIPAADEVPATDTAPVEVVRAVAEPTHLTIPAIKVAHDLIGLGIEPDGAPTVPDARTEYNVPSWYNHGPRPGEPGPAVILGHVDGGGHRGVFADLHKLDVGDEVLIRRTDGTTAKFAVTKVRQVSKDAFPAGDVYDPTSEPELRMITCGGKFDRATRQYADNVIVWAKLV